MPYQSDKQRRFFEGCRHSPSHMKGHCPDEKTLNEFHAASRREGVKRAIHKKLKEKG